VGTRGSQLYDEIGVGYAERRRPDPRIARAIVAALGPAGGAASSVVNVGAGAGSYEPEDRPITAVEISREMIGQRTPGSAPVVQASAVALPFGDGTFGAALAVLTLHHWPDWRAGLGEMRRVAPGRQVLLSWDPETAGFWLTEDYFPQIAEIDRCILPPVDALAEVLGPLQVHSLPIPHDCSDGFLGAWWRRPEAYLDPGVRRAISTFGKIDDVDAGLERLRRDLEDGSWQRRYGDLLDRPALEMGYRLIVAGARS
jgi:SAM-dependent methyltransferase